MMQAKPHAASLSPRLTLIYERLLAYYGEPGWWPAESSYEMMVGAVLTQNCAWRNVELALAQLGDALRPDWILSAPDDALEARIRPAGFFRAKARYLRALTAWYCGHGCDDATLRRLPLEPLRRELLAVPGIGPETCDSILLYAFEHPIFVIDAYTRRLAARLPLPFAGASYAGLQRGFMAALPRDAALYNRYHALIVMHAKAHCTKRSPRCADCPLVDLCAREGLPAA